MANISIGDIREAQAAVQRILASLREAAMIADLADDHLDYLAENWDSLVRDKSYRDYPPHYNATKQLTKNSLGVNKNDTKARELTNRILIELLGIEDTP